MPVASFRIAEYDIRPDIPKLRQSQTSKLTTIFFPLFLPSFSSGPATGPLRRSRADVGQYAFPKNTSDANNFRMPKPFYLYRFSDYPRGADERVTVAVYRHTAVCAHGID